MRRKHLNKLSMYNAVKHVLETNPNSWNVLPAFQGVMTDFTDKVTQLLNLQFEHRFITEHSGATKNSKRKELAQKAKQVQSALIAFAKAEEDQVLYRQIRFAPSRLYYGSTVETTNLVDLVIVKADLYQNELEDYGVTPSVHSELIQLRSEFEQLLNMPRNKTVSRKTITSAITHQVSKIDRLLRDQMDQMVSVLVHSDPSFHTEYFNARVVVDLKGPQHSSGESSQTPGGV